MSKFLVSTTEVFRVDSDDEVKKLIEEAKSSSMFDLSKYSSEYKEVKQKGEVVDSYFKLSFTKVFNDIKEPSQHIKPSYEVDYDL